MFGQFTGQEKTDSGLDFTATNSRSFVVMSQTAGFRGDSLKKIVYEAIHDRHGFTRNSSIGMNLLHYFVNVDRITFLLLLPLFLAIGGTGSFGFTGFLSTFRADFWSHNGQFVENLIKKSWLTCKIQLDNCSTASTHCGYQLGSQQVETLERIELTHQG